MKANYYIHQLRDERALMLLSYLQILPENSAFSERLMACSLQAIIDLKHHHKLNWNVLEYTPLVDMYWIPINNNSSFDIKQCQDTYFK